MRKLSHTRCMLQPCLAALCFVCLTFCSCSSSKHFAANQLRLVSAAGQSLSCRDADVQIIMPKLFSYPIVKNCSVPLKDTVRILVKERVVSKDTLLFQSQKVDSLQVYHNRYSHTPGVADYSFHVLCGFFSCLVLILVLKSRN